MGYVGQTCQDIEKRCNHGRGYRLGTKIRQAFDEHTEGDFVCIILEDGLTKKQADEREKYWISFLGTLWPNGYNLENGGKHHIMHEISKQKDSISKSGEKAFWYGKHLSQEHREKQSLALKGRRCPQEKIEALSKRVQQFTKDGQFIAEYKSGIEASRIIGVYNSGHISQCCLGKRKTAHGYIWRYA